jgi:hypothetical protein
MQQVKNTIIAKEKNKMTKYSTGDRIVTRINCKGDSIHYSGTVIGEMDYQYDPKIPGEFEPEYMIQLDPIILEKDEIEFEKEKDFINVNYTIRGNVNAI